MDEYVYKFKILMVIANLTLQGGQPWSTLFYSLSLGYSIPYLFSCGEVHKWGSYDIAQAWASVTVHKCSQEELPHA